MKIWNKHLNAYIRRNVPVVQWIEFWFPVPKMGVRIPSGTPQGYLFFKQIPFVFM